MHICVAENPTQSSPAALCGIPDSGGLAAIFAGLELTRLHYLAPFSGKATPRVNLDALCPSIAAE